MGPRDALRLPALLVAGLLLYFYLGDERGLVAPDEPRYASIAREMAESGDWVTPRLNGEPWFEKPALLYWLGAAFHAQGEHATRAPVGLLSLAFLLLFHWRMRREFGEREADFAAAILATSGGWVAFSQVGVFDLPLSVALGCALLALLHWTRNRDSSTALAAFGTSLGFAVLGKGLVGPALAAAGVLAAIPLIRFGALAKGLINVKTLVPFGVVAAPWYIACYAVNGAVFLEQFIWKHHVLRLVSPELDHVQSMWFYAPVLALFFAPWTALLAALPYRQALRDVRIRILAGWALAPLVIFSISTNKLPGYILPALVPLAALGGIALARSRVSSLLITICGLTLVALPLAAAVLPDALGRGLSRSWPPDDWNGLALGSIALAALLAGWLQARDRTAAAVAVVSLTAIGGYVLLKLATFSALDRTAGARAIWREIEPRVKQVCVGDVRRHVIYGLDYYSRNELPRCEDQPRTLEVVGDPPRLRKTTAPD